MVPAVSVPIALIARAHALRGGEEEAVVPAVGVLIAHTHALRGWCCGGSRGGEDEATLVDRSRARGERARG